MKVFEATEKMALMPLYDDFTIRIVGNDGNIIEEKTVNVLDFKQDIALGKTFIELKK